MTLSLPILLEIIFHVVSCRPRSRQNQAVPETEEDLHAENKGASGDDLAGDPSGDSVASGSSGFGSLPRKDPTARVSTGTACSNLGHADLRVGWPHITIHSFWVSILGR